MNKQSVTESLIVAVTFIAVFGMEYAEQHPTNTAIIAEHATGVQLQAGPLNLVVQVADDDQ